MPRAHGGARARDARPRPRVQVERAARREDGVARPPGRRPRARVEQPGIGGGPQRQDPRVRARGARRCHRAVQRPQPHRTHRQMPSPRCATTCPRTRAAPIELADRQDALDDWLDAHDVDGVDAEPLARSGLVPADLDALAAAVGVERVGVVLAHESAQRAVRQLATEIDTAASRIHSLVAAVKGFTYVNQQATLMPIAIGQGLSDTITVLRSKARTKSVDVELQRRRASARRRGLRRRAEPGVGEPGRQRHRRHAGRPRACRRRERRRQRRRARHRRRAGHSRRRRRPHLRPVLHDQGHRRRDRPRPRHRPPHRPTASRRHRHEHERARNRVPRHAAGDGRSPPGV